MKGIYDSSLIIISADHGYWKMRDCINHDNLRNYGKQFDRSVIRTKEIFAEMVCSAMPLLAIKRPYSKGPLRISLSQVTVTDIPATINSILNLNVKFDGRSVYEIVPNEERDRRFYYYDRSPRIWDKYYSYLAEFIIKGSAFDKSSWHFQKYHLPNPKSSYQTQKVEFGTSNTSRFLGFGWSNNERDPQKGYHFNWAVGGSSSIFLALPRHEATLLMANIKPYPFSEPQHVTIMVDGNKIGSWELSKSSELDKYSIVIGPDKNRPEISVVEFIFSQKGRPDDTLRPRTALFESITLKEVRQK